MPVLSHGKLHVELLGSTSPSDKVEGMSDFVEKLNKAVCLRFPNNTDRHRIALVDRGESFYKSNGKITHGFVTALRKQGLKAFHGKDAECQPGRSGDLWLHTQLTSKCDCTTATSMFASQTFQKSMHITSTRQYQALNLGISWPG